MRPGARIGDHREIATDRTLLTDLPDPAEAQPIFLGTSLAVARSIGVSVLAVRMGFVLLALASGLGVLLYTIGWWVLVRGHDGPAVPPESADPLRSLGFGLIVAAMLISVTQAGLASGAWMVPAVIIATGVMIAWRHAPELSSVRDVAAADAADGGELTVETRRVFRRDLLRQLGGALLVLVGVGLVVFSRFSFTALRDGLIAGLVVTFGIGLIVGPWVLRAVRTAMAERRERVRSEERAEMAAHLHDSVLQTLTLIQKRSAVGTDEGSREISTLARRQERELRRWLYGRADPPAAEARVRERIDEMVADIEDLHGVAIEAVVVGDAPVDDGLDALCGAVREALVNAAKFSGRPDVSLFVELTPDHAEAFVRDRGRGFDPGDIPDDRHGVRDSIVRRIERAGGRATIRSNAGTGTEVHLELPRRSEPNGRPDA
jgi:signal transduction histidine kinase